MDIEEQFYFKIVICLSTPSQYSAKMKLFFIKQIKESFQFASEHNHSSFLIRCTIESYVYGFFKCKLDTESDVYIVMYTLSIYNEYVIF